jgi:hypothetical protein
MSGSAEVGQVSALQEVLDSQPHRPVHPQLADRRSADPHDFPGLAAGGRLPAGWACGEHHGELLAYLTVAGVEDDVLGVGVDADQSRDAAVDTGLFLRLPDGGVDQRSSW